MRLKDFLVATGALIIFFSCAPMTTIGESADIEMPTVSAPGPVACEATATQIELPMPVTVTVTTAAEPTKESLGVFTITAYCSCEKCCGKWALNRPDGIVYGAAGYELTPGLSIAVDPDVIPYGTKVVIDGHTYIAQDTGSAIVGNRIDLYMDSHETAQSYGMTEAEVFLDD